MGDFIELCIPPFATNVRLDLLFPGTSVQRFLSRPDDRCARHCSLKIPARVRENLAGEEVYISPALLKEYFVM